MKFTKSHHPYAMMTIFGWSLAYVFTRTATECFSAFALGFWRYAIASTLLLILVLVKKIALPKKEDLLWIALSGFLGISGYMMLFNKGQSMVTAATGSVIIATVPVMTALMARFFYGERLKLIQWLAIVIEFIGVLLLMLLDGIFSINPGILWLLGAAVLLASYNLCQRKLTQKYSGFQISIYCIFAGSLILCIFLPQSLRQVQKANLQQLFCVLILGIFSSAIAYVTWSMAFEKANQTSQVSNYMFLTPFMASILGFLINGEIPEKSTAIGGGIILLGVFFFNFGDRFIKDLHRTSHESRR